jgi:hypothetical protein
MLDEWLEVGEDKPEVEKFGTSPSSQVDESIQQLLNSNAV